MNDPNAAAMYAKMAAELAPYQGRPTPEDPHSPAAGGPQQVQHVYLDKDGQVVTSTVAQGVPAQPDGAYSPQLPPVIPEGNSGAAEPAATAAPVPPGEVPPMVAEAMGLSESVLEDGGALIPAVTE